MPLRGVNFYKVKFSHRLESIGFFYNEIIWNHLEDAGKKGLSVPEIRQRSGIQDPTIRKIIKQFIEMKRVKRIKIVQPNNLPNFKYVIRRRWMNVQ